MPSELRNHVIAETCVTPKEVWIVLPFLALLVVLAFGPSLQFGFLFFSDDRAYINHNPYLKSLDWENVVNMFSHAYYGSFIPMTHLSYSLDFTFWKLDPFGYHLTQILLHCANALLLFILFRTLGIHRSVAMGAVALYAVHPVQVESVVWISERKNLLSAFFILLSSLYYIRFTQGKKSGFHLSFLFFILAVLSKSIAVMLPAILVLYDLCIAKRGFKLKEKIPFFLIALATAGGEIYNHRDVEGIKWYIGGSFKVALFFMMRVYWDYFYALLLPFSFSPYHPYSLEHLLTWSTLIPLIGVPLLLIGALRRWRSHPLFAFAVGWFFLWLLPVSSIVPISTIRQDRYMYLPMMVLVLYFSIGVFKIFRDQSREKGAWLVIGGMVVLFGALSGHYAPVYHSDRPYWLQVGKIYPHTSKAHMEVGYSCWIRQKNDCAETYFRRAIQENSQNVLALTNMAVLNINEKNYVRARVYLTQAERFNTDHEAPLELLIQLAQFSGKDQDKIPEWKKKMEQIKTNRHDPFRFSFFQF